MHAAINSNTAGTRVLKSILISGVVMASLAGCAPSAGKGSGDFLEGPADLLYRIHADMPGEPIGEGDFAALTIVERTEEGNVVSDTREEDDRAKLVARDYAYFPGDFNTALGFLSEGDSATFKVNLDSVCTAYDKPRPENTTGRYMIYEVKVHQVLHRKALSDEQYNARIEAYKREEAARARQEEPAKVSRFIAAAKLEPQETRSGLKYIVRKLGTGPVAAPGDTVAVNYTAKYLSGRVFETTDSLTARQAGIFNSYRADAYGPIRMIAPPPGDISGFEEATLTFPAGTSITLILPSDRAYGGDAYRMLKPYTPLLCDMEIVAVAQSK